MTVELSESRVLLTGAAGGIGRTIARTLHARGAHIVLSGRNVDALATLESELGERAEVAVADLADAPGVAALAERAGAVDILVANAGLPGTGKLVAFEPEQIDRTIHVNLRAPMQLARALVPGMIERGSGHLVFVCSLSGKIAAPRASVYCATKFGLRGFGFSLHQELAAKGVGVTTIFPGFIREAGMFVDSGAKLLPGMGTSSPQEVADAVIEGIEKNKAEIDVAPLVMRSGTRILSAAPSLYTALSRRLGGGKIAASVAEGQKDKR
jgi:short-subunit dehydrogenase